MLGSLNRVDSFDSFLAECFSIPTSTSNNDNLIELTCDSVVESAVDFNLSLLGPVVESESMAEAASVAASSGAVLCRDSVKLRISKVEDLLGVHQFAFWRASPSVAASLIVSLCRKELGLQIEEANFTIVRELDRPRCGVLLRVTTVVLNRQILAAKNIFKLRRYFVDLAEVCVSVCDPQNCSCFKNLFCFYCLFVLISSCFLFVCFQRSTAVLVGSCVPPRAVPGQGLAFGGGDCPSPI